MTVAELIAELQMQPQDAQVTVFDTEYSYCNSDFEAALMGEDVVFYPGCAQLYSFQDLSKEKE